jgi:hypothetical protein
MGKSLREMMEDGDSNSNSHDTVASALYWGTVAGRHSSTNSTDSSRLLVTTHEDDDDDNDNAKNLNIAEQVLTVCGDLLEEANAVLDELTIDEDLLGSTIQRGCADLANAIGHLAQQLESQSEDERRDLAQACLEDVRSAQQEYDLLLQQFPPDTSSATASSASASANNQLGEFSTMNESHQLVHAIAAASGFLRDVEETLRAVEQEEAQELADVALTAAKIFVASLQSMHARICPHDLLLMTTGSSSGRLRDGGGSSSTVRIELLEDDDDDDADNDGIANDNEATRKAAATNTNNRNQRAKSQHRKQQMDRLRVLWPPLGPAVSKALAWGKETASSQNPLLSVTLAMILWPAAVTTAIVGTPLVLVDGFLQNMYSHFQDAPLVVGLEHGAAQVFHTGRLVLVTGKVVTRHSLRVVQRQIHRNGGLAHIATNVAGMAVDRILHPVESIGWSVEQIKRLVQHVTDQERETTVQVLQQ